MGFLSKLRRRFQDHKQCERQKEHVEASVLANSTESLAQSSQGLPPQTLPAISGTFPDQNENVVLISVSNQSQSNDTNLPPSSSQNSRELELEKFRQEIDKWKEWKQNHPDRNWIHTVRDIANENLSFLEMLPDGMIPIRGLVKSLVYIFKQTAVFALAKEEVFAFLQEIDKWLLIICAVDSRNGVKDGVWEVLDEIRQLIGNVIRWSSGLQVVLSHWLSDVSVQNQIQAYRKGFAEISTRFGVVSDIKLLQGLDGVTQKVESVAQDVKNMSENDNTIKRLELLKKRLQPRLNEKESYNDQDKRPCDPETRLEILKEIRSWIRNISESSQCFYWLSGTPGVGKSAIMASIAKECLDLRVSILGAQFFINRNDATTTDPRVLFPTICWRLCEQFPQTVAVVMEETLRAQSTLVDDISEDQAAQLFVKAIEAAAATDLSRAVVIVIDALDETDTKRLRDMALIFSKVVADLPRNAKVFISSRTEDAITKPFNSLRFHERVKFSYLGPEHSTTDVSKFMEKEVKKILEDYEMDWDDLGDDTMKTLSSQAAGLFIWAQTALNFFRDEIQDKGKACFAGLLDVLKTEGMNDINMLYLTILRRKCKPGAWEYQRFRHIIGAILVRQMPLSIADMTQLLDLKERSNSQPVDLVNFVRQYRTVLVNDTRDINDDVVPRMHRSFADFITSKRAEEFCVDKRESHKELALRCIDRLDDLEDYMSPDKEPQFPFPRQLPYASRYWQSHVTRVLEPDTNNGEEKQNANDMLDVPEDDTQSLSVNPSSLSKKGLKPRTVEIRSDELESLAFSPDGTQIASSQGKTVQIRDAKTGPVTMTLAGHEDRVERVEFSPDGTQLVSASVDDTARIWDTQTGKVLHVLCGHIDIVYFVGFSHDGRMVVTGSDDDTLRTWDSSTGQLLNVFRGHMDGVDYCTFSRDDQRIASCSLDDEVIVWDVNSGNIISKFNHDCDIISFCLCGNHLMSRSDKYEEFKLWDTKSGDQLGHVEPTIASLVLVKESEQKSASQYIEIPPALSLSEPDSSTRLYVYALKTKTRTIYGIAEHGQDIRVSIIGFNRLF